MYAQYILLNNTLLVKEQLCFAYCFVMVILLLHEDEQSTE